MLKKKLEIILSFETLRMKRTMDSFKAMPKGNLYIRNRSGKVYYSVYHKGKEKWITRDTDAVKNFLLKEALKNDLKVQQSNFQPLQNLTNELKTLDSLYTIEALWANEVREKNTYMKDHLRYKTKGNFFVRSKSERFIADCLYALNIPFRYEQEMYLSGHKVFSDFAILKPNGEVIIWEHFGLMDDEEYYQNALKKIKLYRRAGFVQHKNLICTFEEDLHDSTVVEDIIQRFYYS